MFDAELFGITSKDFLTTAQAIIAPMLGFMFLFLLSLPLKKLPIIDVSDYRPPSWVLPLFAIGSFYMVAFCLSAAFILVNFSVSPSINRFKQSYDLVRRFAPSPAQVQAASITIQEYDGLSNFRIYVNGYRVFGSSSNCVMEYQCKKAGDVTADRSFRELQSLKAIDASIYHIHRLYSLPHTEDISGLFVSGINLLEIHSEDSRLGDCHLEVDFTFATAGDKSVFTIEISPNTGASPSPDQKLQPKEIFFSGGLPVVNNEQDSNDQIPIYGTTRSNGSFRLCQRVRVLFELSPAQLSALDPQWDTWAKKRRRQIVCDIFDDRPEECPK
jgi:hypothetical protein